jgi:hypothetical protein
MQRRLVAANISASLLLYLSFTKLMLATGYASTIFRPLADGVGGKLDGYFAVRFNTLAKTKFPAAR